MHPPNCVLLLQNIVLRLLFINVYDCGYNLSEFLTNAHKCTLLVLHYTKRNSLAFNEYRLNAPLCLARQTSRRNSRVPRQYFTAHLQIGKTLPALDYIFNKSTCSPTPVRPSIPAVLLRHPLRPFSSTRGAGFRYKPGLCCAKISCNFFSFVIL